MDFEIQMFQLDIDWICLRDRNCVSKEKSLFTVYPIVQARGGKCLLLL